MKAIVYHLHLVEPLLVAQVGAGEANSAIGLRHIPGSAVRGALAARWLAKHRGTDLASHPDGRAWFLDGTVCHLNAYPSYQGKRSLPSPASWFVDKERKKDPTATIYDRAVGAAPSKLVLDTPGNNRFCQLTLKEPVGDDEFEYEPEYSTVLLSPARHAQVHITLEDVNRRGEGNQVFRYEALAPGQDFTGVIVAPDDVDLAPLAELLGEGDLLLGKTHLAGYGRAEVQVGDKKEAGGTAEVVVPDWKETQARGPDQTSPLIVTLLSDTILRGEDGQVGWDGGRALAQRLGLPEETVAQRAYGKLIRVGGYNRKWSLPLPQCWALAAGSVFVFEAPVTDQTALAAAIDRGVGDRRAEGFGRIAINWQAAAEVRQREPISGDVDASAPALSAESRDMARDMARRRLRLLLDRSLAQKVVAGAARVRGTKPTNAQLSALRQVTLSGLARLDLKPLLEYLSAQKEKGRRQLQRCQVDNEPLGEWLRDRADKRDVKEQILGDLSLPSMAGEASELDDALRVEYTARLIDGLLRALIKQNQAARGKEVG